MNAIVHLPDRISRPSRPIRPPAYTELVSTSNFSFLRSGSHPEELVSAAMHLGLRGLGLCDRNSFAGVVRGYVTARDLKQAFPDFHYLVGVRLCFEDGAPDIVAYPTNRNAYGRLCKLLTVANKRGEKGKPKLHFADLFGVLDPDLSEGPPEDYTSGQLFILMPDETDWGQTEKHLRALADHVPGNVWLAAAPRFAGSDRARLNRIADMAHRCGVKLIATNDVLYHEPDRRMLQDVVCCIREHVTLETAGRMLEANAERHLKTPAEMARLFAEHPDALTQTQLFQARIGFSLDQLKYNYPEETIGEDETAQETLERLTWQGAERRFPGGLPEKLKKSIWAELCLIAYKRYAAYFLTVRDIVHFARYERKILCQGRGSAANSAVCYCLEITEVNPDKADLVFGRFISTERDEPPDIDVDFEHERREEVMQYVYQKYGGKRTGLTANVISYRSKSALRETAKVFGVSDDTVNALNQLHWGWGSQIDAGEVTAIGMNPDDPVLAQMFEVVRVLRGFPRHLSQHVGGFVITRDSLESLVPISKSAMDSRTIIEWNKDDIDALGILKVDILALGMLSCLRRAFEMMHSQYGQSLTIDMLQNEEGDKAKTGPVYAMTHRADTIGVFQIESRAQMSMLPRLKPVCLYDLVIEVAIVRPGPIQGGMVHPYLKRRQGIELIEETHPDLDAVLHRTHGIPLFQEQAMQIAIVGAGFTPGEADKLRRAMATFKRTGTINTFEARFLDGMARNGHDPEFAKRCFRQIEGFADYGFPESHAASFALLVYSSCWLKCHYPDVFLAALLNSQPMGFYAPAQLVRDAQEHGVEVLPVDINASGNDTLLEETTRNPRDHIWACHAEMADQIRTNKAVRLGLHMVLGFKKEHAELLLARRPAGGYGSVRDLWLRSGLPVSALEKLAEADAFQSLGLSRRDALWAVRGLVGTHGADTLPLFAASGLPEDQPEPDAGLPAMPESEAVVHDYKAITLSLKKHPVHFLRADFDRRGYARAENLGGIAAGTRIIVAGLVLVRQRPGTATGVVFSTLEDETGIANIVIWPKVFEKFRRVILGSRLMAVKGKLQKEGLVIHVIAEDFYDFTPQLLQLADGHDIGDHALARADEGRREGPETSGGRDDAALRRREMAQRQARAALPKGRNFH